MTDRPVTPDSAVIAAYEQAETELGGARVADAKEALRLAAERTGVSYERARDVMIDRFGMRG